MSYKYNWTSLNFLIKIAKNDFFLRIFLGGRVGSGGREGKNEVNIVIKFKFELQSK